jgi:hypothetical protein
MKKTNNKQQTTFFFVSEKFEPSSVIILKARFYRLAKSKQVEVFKENVSSLV